MNIAEFNEELEKRMEDSGHAIGSRAQTNRITAACVEIIKEQLAAGDEVAWGGFGTIKTRTAQPRTARNLHTGETVNVPAKQVVKFVPSASLKEIINK